MKLSVKIKNFFGIDYYSKDENEKLSKLKSVKEKEQRYLDHLGKMRGYYKDESEDDLNDIYIQQSVMESARLKVQNYENYLRKKYK